jgi:hypothetical protein
MTPTECYIHNGGAAGTSADWELVNSGLSTAQVRAMLSASSGVNYNSSTGEFTADQAEIQAFFSAGTGLSYSAGQFSLNADTDDVSEGAINKYFTDSRARLALSAGTGLSYNSLTGQFALNANSDLVSEGSSNLYYTTARVQADIGVSSDPGELIGYSAGEFSLKLSQLRKGFFNQSLTANTALTLTHNLGEKLVHVTAMDSNSEKIDLKVVYISTTQLSITSVVSLTGVDVAISL